MKTFLTVLAVYAGLFIFFVIASILANAYHWLRLKMNKPRIGYKNINIKLLKSDDYVSIDGKIMRFSHFTKLGEMAFDNPLELGSYFIYQPLSLNKCLFIYGKYGTKWAVSKHWASVAKEKIREANE